jgi:hypothetical protein
VHELLHSEWGRLFRNWEKLEIPPDDLEAEGWADVGEDPAELKPQSMRLFMKSLKILGTCIKEAPEFDARRRRRGR